MKGWKELEELCKEKEGAGDVVSPRGGIMLKLTCPFNLKDRILWMKDLQISNVTTKFSGTVGNHL